MSMVGFVLGLGDRHSENMLFDVSSGDFIHIDLNCIFQKGETFQVPERVPFRLTHNLRDAMGLTKEEGVFRCVCETTLRELRKHRLMLMTVLETLIYDPLVDWKSSKKGSKKENTEAGGESEIRTVEQKLLGLQHQPKIEKIAKVAHGLAMSVEAHVVRYFLCAVCK